MKLENYCIDCKTNIRNDAKRCWSCHVKSRNGKDAPNYKGLIKVECNYCKKIKLIYPYEVKTLKHHFCNRNCRSKWLKEQIPWNKGLTKNTDKRVAKGVDKLSIIRKEIFKGEKNPFFGKNHTEETRKIFSLQRGGTGTPYENSKYPIEWNEKLRNKIRERDNYTCKNCGMGQEENIVIYGRDLEVHHIDYNKENTNEDNLITLCLHCHRRTNYNRDYWINFFKIKIW